jgi:hypothetical protein
MRLQSSERQARVAHTPRRRVVALGRGLPGAVAPRALAAPLFDPLVLALMVSIPAASVLLNRADSAVIFEGNESFSRCCSTQRALGVHPRLRSEAQHRIGICSSGSRRSAAL